ncbi:MAG: AMP-binding protein [Bacilli bacterium]|nr:AMP-binding protein [Bacilli bacterium]
MNQRTLQRVYTRHLRESKPTFENIFEINFSHTDFPIFEYDENGETIKISYPEAKQRIREVARGLEELIPEKNIFIGLNIDSSPNWVIGFWAILMSGNKPYLINLRHPKNLTKSILETLKVKYLLSDGENEDFGLKNLQISDIFYEIEANHQFNFANEIALSTSGTTMNEKICIYSGKEILAQLSNTEYILSKCRESKRMYKKTIKLLAFLPLYHIFGLIAVYFWFTYFGYTLVFLKDYSPQTILHTVRKHEVTHIFAVPLLWRTIEDEVRREVHKKGEALEEKFNKGIAKINNLQNINYALGISMARRHLKEVRNALFGDSVKFCISGGSYLNDSTLKLMSGIGYPLYNGYGASEIGITSFELSKKPKHRLLNSIGKPFPSVSYQIVDGTLRVKGQSTCHSIIIEGKEIHTDEWFDTLDIAHVDETGRYYIDGRKTDLIITENGENVNPDEIEKNFNFSSFPVLYFSVIGLGEKRDDISLIIQPNKKLQTSEIEEIKKYIDSVNETLPFSHKIKSLFLSYDDIQNRNAIKVSRTYLRKGIEENKIHLLSFDKAIKNEEYESTSLTEILIDLFQEALNVDRSLITPTSHFLYDLNGTSLDYFALLSLVNARFNTNISFDPNDPLATVQDFERYLTEHMK